MHSSHQWPQLVVCSSIQGKALRKCIQAPMYTHVQERTVCVLSMFVLCSIIKPPLINATATTPLHPASSSAAADRAQNYQVASNPVKGEQYYQFHLQERREFGEGSWKMEMDGHCIAFSDRSHSFLPVPMICVMSLDRCIYFPLPTFLLEMEGRCTLFAEAYQLKDTSRGEDRLKLRSSSMTIMILVQCCSNHRTLSSLLQCCSYHPTSSILFQ